MKERVQRTVSPVDGSVYVERELASAARIENVLERAVAAQESWKQVPVRERARLCIAMAAWCVERSQALAQELTWQMGRPLTHTPLELQRGFHERAAYMAGIAESTLVDIDIEPRDNFER
ncbi:MAG TPA: aldehyde dehydrogenase family protein, partial [Burkholderiales bacterium]|nr:aldehyde dehydrogenase family protein [Burkholderiales bacterium]